MKHKKAVPYSVGGKTVAEFDLDESTPAQDAPEVTSISDALNVDAPAQDAPDWRRDLNAEAEAHDLTVSEAERAEDAALVAQTADLADADAQTVAAMHMHDAPAEPEEDITPAQQFANGYTVAVAWRAERRVFEYTIPTAFLVALSGAHWHTAQHVASPSPEVLSITVTPARKTGKRARVQVWQRLADTAHK